MNIDAQHVLIAGICDFGWGSLGKLRLILDQLPPVSVALFGDPGFNGTIRELLAKRHRFISGAERADVALVINDPRAADRIAERGVPVIYVDSLPYLWARADELPNPSSVACYCAQNYPRERSPVAPPLQDWHNLRWIEPIVPNSSRRRGRHGVVINLGGLHSHLVGNTVEAYLALVLIPLVRELKDTGMPVAAVCGNLPGHTCRQVQELLPDCPAIGRQSPYRFESILQEADLLVTSPGSTTILQAFSMGLPTLLLPPQNLSQILNTRVYAAADAPTMDWPGQVIVLEEIERLRPLGEDAVLRYIYDSISAAAASRDRSDQIADVIRSGLRNIPDRGVLDPALTILGSSGAAQVARLLKQAMLAPLPRPS
jgi:hydroxymethylcytosylglucuronate/cytosylglucuronate synthase